jgi:hypothetical protein
VKRAYRRPRGSHDHDFGRFRVLVLALHARLQRAELARERGQLRRRERLGAEQQHAVPREGLFEPVDGRPVQRPGHVHAVHLGAADRTQRPDVDRHRCSVAGASVRV